ncbi:MAG: arginine deiminase family protein [bacterium]
MFTKAIVRPPGPNFGLGLTTANLGEPVYERALAQHSEYCAALKRCGLSLIHLEPDARYPDGTFVEDTAVLTRSGAILARPGAEFREGEVEAVRTALASYFSSSSTIEPPGTLDGGDICEAGNHFFIGISLRTNPAAAEQLAELLAKDDYTSSTVDVRDLKNILHLKSGLTALGDNRLVVIAELAGRGEFAGYDLVKVPEGEEYAANCVRINEYVLVAAGHHQFAKSLHRLGYQTIELEISEFQKMDGGLSCLSLRF